MFCCDIMNMFNIISFAATYTNLIKEITMKCDYDLVPEGLKDISPVVVAAKIAKNSAESNKHSKDKMSPKERLFWIVTKLLIIVGTVMYFYDVGSDISFSVQLYLNCHVNYCIAAISIIALAVLLSCIFPAAYANIDKNLCFEGPGYLLKYLTLNLTNLMYCGEGDILSTEEKEFVHNVKFLESIIESIPQIGLSFYILHHHELDKPVIFGFEGDIQILSLVGSILSINISMATRRAWWKMRGKSPQEMEIFWMFLWNFVPLTCFLVGYYIIMADSKWILLAYCCISPIACITFLIVWMCKNCISETFADKFEKWMGNSRFSINKFLLANTFVMACLHSIQFAIGSEDQESLIVKPFNLCDYSANSDSDDDDLDSIHEDGKLYLTVIWTAVVCALVHIFIETKYSTTREQPFFLWFILDSYDEEYDDNKSEDESNKDVELEEGVQASNELQVSNDNVTIEKETTLVNLPNDEMI